MVQISKKWLNLDVNFNFLHFNEEVKIIKQLVKK